MIKSAAICKLALSAVCVGLFAAAAVTPAHATLRSGMDQVRKMGAWCAAHETNIADDYTANSAPADDAAWSDSVKAYNKDYNAEQNCDGHDDYVNALLASWDAQILHHQGQDWKTKMDTANQLLGQCATQFSGTDKGTKCAADLKANTQLQTAWLAK